jgi:16S rRNA (guanine527-N7)-methyltransferase
VVLNLTQIEQKIWIADLGSGGGFPAIPLKIVRPDLQFLLIESIRKKSLFVRKIISDLRLDNITVLNERIEIVNQNAAYQKKFDIVTARAVASIPQLAGWGKSFLKNNGYFLFWKGSFDVTELTEETEKSGLGYQILSVPEHLQHLSSKFRELKIFKLYSN